MSINVYIRPTIFGYAITEKENIRTALIHRPI